MKDAGTKNDPESLRSWLDQIELSTSSVLEPLNTNPVPLRSGELLRQVFSFLWSKTHGATFEQIIASVSKSIELSETELAPSPALPSFSNFEISLRSTMAAVSKAGWLVKIKGRWHVTEEGRLICKDFSTAQDFFIESQKQYQDWLARRPSFQIAFESAEDLARSHIREYLLNLSPQGFRSLVRHLLEAMKYHVSWAAPLNKDRGFVDMIVHPDPLGLKHPRMIVHIKHGEQAFTVDESEGTHVFTG